MREIEVAASLVHPHVVSYIEHGTHNGTFIWCRICRRDGLVETCQHHGGKLTYQEVVKIIEQLGGTRFAHLWALFTAISKTNILVDWCFSELYSKLTDSVWQKVLNKPNELRTMVGDVAGQSLICRPNSSEISKKFVRRPIFSDRNDGLQSLTGNTRSIYRRERDFGNGKAIFEKPIVPLLKIARYSAANRLCHRTAIAKEV